MRRQANDPQLKPLSSGFFKPWQKEGRREIKLFLLNVSIEPLMKRVVAIFPQFKKC